MEMSKFLSSMSLYRRRLRPKPRFWALMIGAMAAAFAISCMLGMHRAGQLDARLENLAREKAALSRNLEETAEMLEYAQTDAYVERIARDELNLLYPGEIRYIAN